MAPTLLTTILEGQYGFNCHDRAKVIAIIQAGQVLVNDEVIRFPHLAISKKSIIRIKKQSQWVSRGGAKLAFAITTFNLNFNNKIVLDIGSSTGGFTDVALTYGAQKVYALDVGTNQLAYKLRINPRVVVMEQTNLKTITSTMFKDEIKIVVVDVAFIALHVVFKVISFMSNLDLVTLIKPQFEAAPSLVERGGYVAPHHHDQIIEQVKQQAKQHGFVCHQLVASPITGHKAKNIEYLAYFRNY